MSMSNQTPWGWGWNAFPTKADLDNKMEQLLDQSGNLTIQIKICGEVKYL